MVPSAPPAHTCTAGDSYDMICRSRACLRRHSPPCEIRPTYTQCSSCRDDCLYAHTPPLGDTPHIYTVCSLQRNAASERAHLNQHCDTAGGANDLAVGQAVRPITSGFSTSRPIRSTVAMDCTPPGQRSVPADPILNAAAISTAHRPLYIC